MSSWKSRVSRSWEHTKADRDDLLCDGAQSRYRIPQREKKRERKVCREKGVRVQRYEPHCFYSGPFGATTSVETSFSVELQIPGRNMRTIMGFRIINLLYRVYYLSATNGRVTRVLPRKSVVNCKASLIDQFQRVIWIMYYALLLCPFKCMQLLIKLSQVHWYKLCVFEIYVKIYSYFVQQFLTRTDDSDEI